MMDGRRAWRPPRIGYALQSGLIKGVLLFLAGLFAGANLLYFVLSRQSADPAASAGMSQDTTEISAGPPQSPSPVPSSVRPEGGKALPPQAPGNDARAPAPNLRRPAVPGAPPRSSAVAPGGAPQALLIPVQGVLGAQLQDTFTDSRAQGRNHEAIDIMAPAGTPVLAVADGTVEKLFTSDAGGLTVYQFEPSGRYAYYYAHLQGYAPGLAEKQALRRGDVIGYVGSTGNANPAAPHLHFAVFELGPERRWWQGTAINPYPLLRRP